MELTDPGTYKSLNKVPRSSPGKSSCLQVLGIIPGDDHVVIRGISGTTGR
jgi:hypothetical protein